jgi:hypothetical protein
VEVEERTRRVGAIPFNPQFGDECCEVPPICFVESYDIANEFEKLQGDRTQKLLEVIIRSRDASCKDTFVKWQAGYSPKEIYDMALSKEMLAIQHSREDADRQWRKEETGLQRAWQAEQTRLADERHRETIRVAVASGRGNVWSNLAGGVIAAAAAIAAVYISNALTKPSNSISPPAQTAKP